VTDRSKKQKLAFYWAASCGGCDVAVLDTDEKILDIAAAADIYLWPIAMDFKYKEIENMEDGFLDVTFINGSVRNSDTLDIVHLLRRKSKVLVALGSCACFGGIPALANLTAAAEIFSRAYETVPSVSNPERTLPQVKSTVAEGELTLPEFYGTVYSLPQVTRVEYLLPGCPPPAELVAQAVSTILAGDLPPAPAVLAPDRALCDSCPRKKGDKVVSTFHRVHQVKVDPERCLLEQGIVCMGPATRDGCGARCIEANMPCRGCFGPTAGATDQGAKMLSALATLVATDDEEAADKVLAGVADPAGTLYRFAMSSSLLLRKRSGAAARATRTTGEVAGV